MGLRLLVRRYAQANAGLCIRRGNRRRVRDLSVSALPDHRRAQRVLAAVLELLRVGRGSDTYRVESKKAR